MMRLLFLLVVGLLQASCSLAASRETFNYFFILDTSGSMVGKPAGSGNAVILPKLKEAVTQFLNEVAIGSRVAVLPFDSKVHDAKWVTLANEQDRQGLKDFVDGLEAKGSRTCLYSALAHSFEWIKTLRARYPNGRNISTILLYSDGLNECDDTMTLDEVLKRFKLTRGENDILFWTSLGVELAAADRAKLTATPGVRYAVEPKGQISAISLVEARPAALDFGDIGPGGEATRSLVFNFDGRLAGREVAIRFQGDELAESEAVQVRPERFALSSSEVGVTLKLLNRESFRQRGFTGQLELVAADERVVVTPRYVPVSFSTAPPRAWAIASPSGLPMALGEIGFDAAGRASVQARLLLQPSASARSEGSTLSLEVAPEPSNPSPLQAGRDVFIEGGGERGARLEANPATGEARLVLSLDRKRLEPGQYAGRVIVVTADSTLQGQGLEAVAGTERVKNIRFSFTVGGDRVITIAAAAGPGLPLDLGSAVKERITEKDPAVLEKPLSVTFSPDAVAKGAKLRADLELPGTNPSPLEAGKDVLLVAGAQKGGSVPVTAGDARVLVRVLVPASAKEGDYKGRVVFWPESAQLAGAGLEKDPRSAAVRVASFLFTVEADKRLTVTAAAPFEGGKVRPPLKLERKYKLAWSTTAARAGASALASIAVQPAAELGRLTAGATSGREVKLAPGDEELTLELELPASLATGDYKVAVEIRGDHCAVVGPTFAGSEGAAVETLELTVPRPLWIDITLGAIVLALIAAWAYQASIPRFSAMARLTVEEGASPGSYYLRGHQRRFSREVTVGGRGAADLPVEGLIGRMFAVRVEGGSRYRVVAHSPLTVRNAETGTEETVGPGRSTTLPDGASIEVGGVKLLFSERL